MRKGDENNVRESVTSFACRCSEAEEKECDDVLALVKEKLDPTEHNLVSRIIASLEWDYLASVGTIAMDQWFGISSQTHDNHEDGLFTWVQCDMVEDGLAFTWKAYYDKYGDDRNRSEVYDRLKANHV